MLVHKLTGFGVFRIVQGEPIFCEFKKEKRFAEKEKKIYDKTYNDDKTEVYPVTILLEC